MIRNESSAPYLLAFLMTGGLSTLLIGVELGVHDSSLAQPLQAVGGAVIVLGILGLAHYVGNLPGGEAEH
jgi:hypothetical protein